MSDSILNLIKSNRPEVLTADNDFLGTIPKGEMIVDFLKKINDNKEAQIQMLALYGEWGSGKTSLMQWIKANLPKENFHPVFFEAWQHENDDNMALSMVDVISKDIYDGKHELRKEIGSALSAILKGISKSITITLPGIRMNLEKIIQEAENYLSEDESTFYEKVESFKETYKDLEDKILGQDSGKQLVIFIDDLDRCEPQSVLELLSVIKLFFTYGKRTIFICGLDKEAVNKAVLHKYKDVIKANEYLEKLFDISFTMPKVNVEKIVKYYLGYDKDIIKQDIIKIISFLNAINFNNPRHLKKILNKYLLIKLIILAKQN